MIKTIYLDMDGVITNFVGSINEHMGIPKETIPTKWNWVEDYGFTFKQANNWCTIDFWQNLEWMHDGHDIMRLVTSTLKFHLPPKIYLLTTPMPNPGSYTGKALWVQLHLPEYSKRLIITTAPKSLFAKSGTLLIDDKDENVEKFVKAGGKAILVPRPWNKLHGQVDETYQVVKNSLENLT